MSYSRRQLYALGEPLGDSVTCNKVGGGRIYGGGGGGGGSGSGNSAPTQTTVQNTNIPDYAQPYVESMLGATQQQLFNTSTDAGAKHLYKMMDKVRHARTGRKAQGKQIKAEKYQPA